YNSTDFLTYNNSHISTTTQSKTNKNISRIMLISQSHNSIIPTSSLLTQPRHSTKTFILLCIDPLTSNPLCTVLLARLGLFPAEQKITIFLTRNFIDIILEMLISSLSEYTSLFS